MAFNWNFKPRTLNGFNSAPVESLMSQAPGAIPTQMKGQDFSPDYNIQGLPQDTEDYQRAAYMNAYEADEAQKAQALQAQQVGQQKRIADIQNEIATLEKRIAENTAKLQNFSGNADKIAAIEARKINVNDPTSIWRWKVDHDEARRIANAQNKTNDVAKANALIEANNILDSMIVDDSLDTPTKNAMLSKLADVKTSLEKNGFDTTRVNSMISKLKGNGPQTPREQAKTTWHGLQGKKDLTSAELDAAINDPNMKWDPNELEDAKNLSAKLKKQEAAAQDVKNMKNWLSTNYGINYSQLDADEQKSWQEIWKAQNKGK